MPLRRSRQARRHPPNPTRRRRCTPAPHAADPAEESGRDDVAAGARAAAKAEGTARPHHQERKLCRPAFPEEARKIHYGETEHRSIYGEASPDEAKELHEEGIEFHPLPILPDDKN